MQGNSEPPWHIIDFIVKVVDPTKEDTILDPARGTAGFLISSFKHILQHNTLKRLGDQLTPDERTRLMRHFVGYDISPDMVRLSLVNLYLHGFPNPNIREYDTLTSEERWDEQYDVIMANPPFMTPKGGIRPHKRFAIKANRSEVLFVDYIAEHITINGRAGVIVPEGIIFQSQTAYKALRKMLVEKYVWAVVSLPAGVFQPYSGVKTSILLMDKNLAKKANTILFVKIGNDGFDLGAQRRPIDKNDLPKALVILQHYKQAVQNGEEPRGVLSSSEVSNVVVVIAEKSLIAKNGDYNLSGERYRETIVRLHQKWPMVDFQEVCTLEYGAALPERERRAGNFPVVGSNGITGWHDEFLIEGPAIIVGRKGSAGEVVWVDKNCFPIDTSYYVKTVESLEVGKRYLYYVLKDLNLTELRGGGAVPGLNRNDVYETKKIPLPPLEAQHEIVAELDYYQQIIDGAKQVVETYKPQVKIDPQWESVELGDAISFVSSGSTPLGGKENYLDTGILFIRSQNILRGVCDFSDAVYISPIAIIRVQKEKLLPEYLVTILNSDTLQIRINDIQNGASRQALNYEQIRQLHIPLPPLDLQRQIAAQISEEQKRVQATKELIGIFEQKIKDKIAEVWGELEVSEAEVKMSPQPDTFKQPQPVQQAEVEQPELELGEIPS